MHDATLLPAAHTVTQLNTILLQNLQARLFPKPYLPVRINDRFNEVNNLVDITDDKVFLEHPSSLLEVFYLLCQRSDLKNMTARTLRACGTPAFTLTGISEAIRPTSRFSSAF